MPSDVTTSGTVYEDAASSVERGSKAQAIRVGGRGSAPACRLWAPESSVLHLCLYRLAFAALCQNLIGARQQIVP
jgi:hypothetical protein